MATNTYVALNKVTANGTTSTISLTSIPQTYTDLVLVVSGGSVGGNGIKWRANGDSGTSYGFQFQRGNSGGVAAARYNQTSGLIAWFATNTLGVTAIANFMNYSTSGVRKSVLCKGGYAASEVSTNVNTWTGTAPITSLEIFDESGTNILSGTTFSLYGIAAQPVATAKATGGTITYAADGYTYHAFTSSGTFTPSQALSCDVLVVAGGGSQGAFYGGGGGGGGLRGLTSRSMTTTGYTVTVGAGGAATSGASIGNQGTNSSIAGSGFTTISATGGGGGGGNYGQAPTTGGSGGGAGSYTTGQSGATGNAGGYTPVEGYAGEACFSGNTGGAGGGASEAGGTRALGYGGNGSLEYSQWGLATNTGENVSGVRYYAGGGCGNSPARIGGYGGGGSQTGRNGASAWVGHANTGGGSGSAADNNGYAGGSGIVIIRYASA